MKTKLTKILPFLLLFTSVNAGIGEAWKVLRKTRGNVKYYPTVIENLIEDKMYFTAIPYVKEYMANVKTGHNSKIDQYIDRIITEVGVRPFEILSTRVLRNSNAPIVRYILAKKYFRRGKYQQALAFLDKSIPKNHVSKPFALMLEASSFSILKKYQASIASYKKCIEVTEDQMSDYKDYAVRYRQLSLNRDYCVVGVARSLFAAGKFEAATLKYLDLPKDSFIWPEILFEEAWNSFYQRDYNRTLGKLVTYKAPLLEFIFNPEIDVLRALTYMELCLWNDTKKVINEFYEKYQKDSLTVKKFMNEHRKDYKYYYLLAKSFDGGKLSGNKLLNKLLKKIIKDSSYIELIDSFKRGKLEIDKIKTMARGQALSIFTKNIKQSMLLQRDLIGAYVRKSILTDLRQLDKNFEGMSYIKLEVLGREKSIIYNTSSGFRSRGDIKNLKRNEKQYFWDFRGEFWADELGDYVFSLKSECKNE